MSDRAAASNFARIFIELEDALRGAPNAKKIFVRIWKLARDQDFEPEQMEIMGLLLRIGLAAWDEEGNLEYANADGRFD